MKYSEASSFGLYETMRILIPGFYFSTLALLFARTLSDFFPIEFTIYEGVLAYLFLLIVSGFILYAKDTAKKRRAFTENQPSLYLQNYARRFSDTHVLNDSEALQLYLYILNNSISSTFHDKILFFGTIYHIMIYIRRISFWFSILSLLLISVLIAYNIPLLHQSSLIMLSFSVIVVYLLNVKYNKADKRMQENYQDQIFWLQMNEPVVHELIVNYFKAKKGPSA